MSQSHMVATAGNFTISIWEDTLIDIFDRFGPQPTLPVTQTGGLFSIWTDASTISFKNTAAQVGSEIDINPSDEEPIFKSEETSFITSAVAGAIYGNQHSSSIEIDKGQWTGPNGVRVTLSRESHLNVKDVPVNGGKRPVSIGAGIYGGLAIEQSGRQDGRTVRGDLQRQDQCRREYNPWQRRDRDLLRFAGVQQSRQEQHSKFRHLLPLAVEKHRDM